MYFEWDENKNKINIEKRGISFEVAKLIFNDPNILSIIDDRYSVDERWISLGNAAGITILYVAHTYEEDQYGEEVIRIISARKATKSERKRYIQSDF